jgi:hypothetical protein
MAKKSPKGINTIFQQTASALKAARQTQIFAKIKRNIPYFTRKIIPSRFLSKMGDNSDKRKENTLKITKKLSKFAKKIK